MHDHTSINWFHSIDLGDGIVTKGKKSAEALQKEFCKLQLSADTLRGKTLLDIGCNDGYMSLRCEAYGAHVTSIDGVCTPGLALVRNRLKPKLRFYAMDMLSPSFYELGRFDIVLYLGVLYHTLYPVEQLLRLATVCAPNATLLVESAYFNLAGYENAPTLMFNYDRSISEDLTSPCFPSIAWIEQSLSRLGFAEVTVIDRHPTGPAGRGRVTIRARYPGTSAQSPVPYSARQMNT